MSEFSLVARWIYLLCWWDDPLWPIPLTRHFYQFRTERGTYITNGLELQYTEDVAK
jgi:hypothetical protein